MDAWQRIVAHYAEGRPVCNCGRAYYTPCGRGVHCGQDRTDLPACAGGCSSNQLSAKEELAQRLVVDLGLPNG